MRWVNTPGDPTATVPGMRLATVGKLLGLAGLAGVAATGAVLARDERQRRAYTPDDVRARLHARAERRCRGRGPHRTSRPRACSPSPGPPPGAGGWPSGCGGSCATSPAPCAGAAAPTDSPAL